MSLSEPILTPVGRLVQGSLYEPNTTDMEGRPLMNSKGEATVRYFFAIAIPKGTEQHWAETAWGKKIWDIGHTSFPNGQAQSPNFSWKIVNGDSIDPDTTGKKPCDKDGFPGHWILKMTSGFAPKIVDEKGTQYLLDKDAVNLGDYIQVYGTVTGNESTQKPGVFLNHSHVAFVRYGKRINTGIDPKSIGFGQNTVIPPGASTTPISQGFVPPVASVNPPLPVPTPMTSVMHTPAMPVPSSVPIVPHYGILNTPPVPTTTPVRVMLPKAQGYTYEQLIAAGWNDTTLIQHGMMQA